MKQSFLDIMDGIQCLHLETGPSGNISFLDNGILYIKPTGMMFGDKKLAEYSIESFCALNGLVPSSDLSSHLSVLSYRKDIKAIYHTHSHYSVLASLIGKDIPVFTTMHADYFGQPIHFLPFSNHRKDGFGPSDNFKSGEVFLLGNHGGLILFKFIDECKIINTISAFEEICRLFCEYSLASLPVGCELQSIDLEHINSIHSYYNDQYGL